MKTRYSVHVLRVLLKASDAPFKGTQFSADNFGRQFEMINNIKEFLNQQIAMGIASHLTSAVHVPGVAGLK